MGLTIPWKKLAAWAIEQAAKWGVGKLTTTKAEPPKPPKKSERRRAGNSGRN